MISQLSLLFDENDDFYAKGNIARVRQKWHDIRTGWIKINIARDRGDRAPQLIGTEGVDEFGQRPLTL